jgi:hypothetical protein
MKKPVKNSAALAALAVVTTGCGNMYPHVKLDEAPTTQAEYALRADYYKKHAADSFDGNGMMLHDGTHIYWPEDLKPAVDPGSPTAKAIARVEEGRKALEPMENIAGISSLVAAGGLATMGASLVPMMIGAVTYDSESTTDDLMMLMMNASLGLLGLGGVAVCGGGLVAATVPLLYMEESQRFNEAIQSTLATYPQSLSDRVGIQPDANGRLVDVTTGIAGDTPAPKTAGIKEL